MPMKTVKAAFKFIYSKLTCGIFFAMMSQGVTIEEVVNVSEQKK